MNRRLVREYLLSRIRARMLMYSMHACQNLLSNNMGSAERAAKQALHYEDLYSWAIGWFGQ
jgi:hypothetical protein